MTFITKQEKFVQVREFAKYVMEQAGKGQTIAALVEDFNTTAEVLGFGHLWIAKPGRVAKLIEAMEHVLKRLDAMPEYAERVPDVTPEKYAEHLEHAEQLRGIFRSHGIDPKDFDACLDYIIGNGNIVPRYWAKIYVDYIHGDDLDATRYTASLPPLGRGAVFVDLEGRDGVTITPHDPADSDTARVLQDVINHGIGAFSADLAAGHTIHHALERVLLGAPPRLTCDMADALHYAMTTPPNASTPIDWAQGYGRGMRADFRSFTDQEARAAFNYQDKCKFNKFPRGKCAKRMLTLGWHFNED